MSIMHGDNSGIYQAMHQLAWFNRRLGNNEKAVEWEKRAEVIKENMIKYMKCSSRYISYITGRKTYWVVVYYEYQRFFQNKPRDLRI